MTKRKYLNKYSIEVQEGGKFVLKCYVDRILLLNFVIQAFVDDKIPFKVTQNEPS